MERSADGISMHKSSCFFSFSWSEDTSHSTESCLTGQKMHQAAADCRWEEFALRGSSYYSVERRGAFRGLHFDAYALFSFFLGLKIPYTALDSASGHTTPQAAADCRLEEFASGVLCTIVTGEKEKVWESSLFLLCLCLPYADDVGVLGDLTCAGVAV
jgi:hypothetical protein